MIYELKCGQCGVIGELEEYMDEFECPQCGGMMTPVAPVEKDGASGDDTPTISISRAQISEYKETLKVAKAVDVGFGGVLPKVGAAAFSNIDAGFKNPRASATSLDAPKYERPEDNEETHAGINPASVPPRQRKSGGGAKSKKLFMAKSGGAKKMRRTQSMPAQAKTAATVQAAESAPVSVPPPSATSTQSGDLRQAAAQQAANFRQERERRRREEEERRQREAELEKVRQEKEELARQREEIERLRKEAEERRERERREIERMRREAEEERRRESERIERMREEEEERRRQREEIERLRKEREELERRREEEEERLRKERGELERQREEAEKRLREEREKIARQRQAEEKRLREEEAERKKRREAAGEANAPINNAKDAAGKDDGKKEAVDENIAGGDAAKMEESDAEPKKGVDGSKDRAKSGDEGEKETKTGDKKPNKAAGPGKTKTAMGKRRHPGVTGTSVGKRKPTGTVAGGVKRKPADAVKKGPTGTVAGIPGPKARRGGQATDKGNGTDKPESTGPVPDHGVTHSGLIRMQRKKKKSIMTIIFTVTGVATVVLCLLVISMIKGCDRTAGKATPAVKRRVAKKSSGSVSASLMNAKPSKLTESYNAMRNQLMRNPTSAADVDANIKLLEAFLAKHALDSSDRLYIKAEERLEHFRKLRKMY